MSVGPSLSWAGLVAWIGVSCLGFWVTRHAPEPLAESVEDKTVRARQLSWVARDVQRFDETLGDRTLDWDTASGHLVIVIDDVGRELVAHDRMQSLRYPITFSVLPGSVYAAGAQLRLRDDARRPRDILLHLPMEPMGTEAMFSGDERQESFLLASDSDEELARKTAAALARVPAAIGVNNHMGSRLTADPRAMRAVMGELGRRGLPFLDSRTTAETVAADAARAQGLLTLERAVFLDHDQDPAAMRASVVLAVERAKHGPTLAIGHPSEALASILEAELDVAWEEGVAVFPIHEFWARAAP